MEKPTDADFDYATAQRQKLIFIRHGESEWNHVFNKGPILSRPFKLCRALFQEVVMIFQPDSLFLDSPLSSKGIQQAWDLLTFLASQPEGCQGHRSPERPCSELDVPDI